MNPPEKNYKYLGDLSVLFVSVLLISNIASTKIVYFWGLSLDGGTLLFPLCYIFDDILTEVYGYKKARRVIWLGFSCALVMALLFMIIGKLPASADWGNQSAYDLILGSTPRIILASLVAYLFGTFSNSFILAKIKIATKGKKLWMRTIGSTVVGELLDSSIFILIAFLGVLPSSLLFALIVSNYLFKTAIEVLFTPLTYKIVNFLKKKEDEDYFDNNTNFNPFSFK